MTFTDARVSLSQLVRTVIRAVRDAIKGEEPVDPVDRFLAALTMAAGAVVLGWPQGRKAPKIVSVLARAARQLWQRRGWLAVA